MIVLDAEYDEIKVVSKRILFLRKGDKYGYVSYDIISSSSGMFSSLSKVDGVLNVFVSDIIYDKVDVLRVRGYGTYIMKDGKYGSPGSYGVLPPPIYDTIPKHISNYQHYIKKDRIDRNLYSVIKDGKYGFLLITINEAKGTSEVKELIPPIYNKNELYKIGLFNYLINQKGKPIRIYHTKDSTYTTIHTADGKPILSYGGGNYSYWFDDVEYNILDKSKNTYDSTIEASKHFTYMAGYEHVVEKKNGGKQCPFSRYNIRFRNRISLCKIRKTKLQI